MTSSDFHDFLAKELIDLHSKISAEVSKSYAKAPTLNGLEGLQSVQREAQRRESLHRAFDVLRDGKPGKLSLNGNDDESCYSPTATSVPDRRMLSQASILTEPSHSLREIGVLNSASERTVEPQRTVSFIGDSDSVDRSQMRWMQSQAPAPIQTSYPEDENDMPAPARRRSKRTLTGRRLSGVRASLISSISTEEAGTLEDEEVQFRMWPVWHDLMQSNDCIGKLQAFYRCRKSTSNFELQSNVSSLISRDFMRLTAAEKRLADSCARLIMHPSSQFSLTWSLLGMLFVVYDVIMIPMAVFKVPGHQIIDIFTWTIRVYWTMDIICNFLTGYHQGGNLVIAPTRIFYRYITGWFPLDLFLVIIDWSLLLDDEDESSTEEMSTMETLGIARVGKSFRVLRILRIFRLMRLVKLPKYLVKIEERIQNEYAVVCIGILKLICCVLVVNHLVACMWYAVGSSSSESMNWIKKFNFTEASLGYKYASSLHWALTQFTPAAMEVYPTNESERICALVVLIFGLVTFSSFVSSITNALSRLHNMNSEYAKQLLIFHRYIVANKISKQLAVRMKRHLESRLIKGQARIEERDVQCLRILSEPLLMELRLEIYKPSLDQHAFFERLCEVNPMAMRKMCHTSILEFGVSTGDCIFSSGESCEKMYFVKSGTLRYTPDFSDTGDDENTFVNEWLCESCLWTPWIHIGLMQASTKATLMTIDSQKFRECIRAGRSNFMQPSKYAMCYVNHLNELVREGENLTDREMPLFNIEHIVEKLYNDQEDSPGSLEEIIAKVNGIQSSPSRTSSAAFDSSPRSLYRKASKASTGSFQMKPESPEPGPPDASDIALRMHSL
eukprot:TRINITY_DN44816_c0_g2_i1.p1 TRINITY_DN44816_c0_g2~~TRINITY_DN44816_c0_g2_i1.p1  ORF type:complete len:842 (-),score=171.99 TRINITY_DN44816_c0_g2_i1:206-2731(-)